MLLGRKPNVLTLHHKNFLGILGELILFFVFLFNHIFCLVCILSLALTLSHVPS